jgi:hypothetical protein
MNTKLFENKKHTLKSRICESTEFFRWITTTGLPIVSKYV